MANKNNRENSSEKKIAAASTVQAAPSPKKQNVIKQASLPGYPSASAASFGGRNYVFVGPERRVRTDDRGRGRFSQTRQSYLEQAGSNAYENYLINYQRGLGLTGDRLGRRTGTDWVNTGTTPYAIVTNERDYSAQDVKDIMAALEEANAGYAIARRSGDSGAEARYKQQKAELQRNLEAANIEVDAANAWLAEYDAQMADIEGFNTAWAGAQERGLDSFGWYEEALAAYNSEQDKLNALYNQRGQTPEALPNATGQELTAQVRQAEEELARIHEAQERGEFEYIDSAGVPTAIDPARVQELERLIANSRDMLSQIEAYEVGSSEELSAQIEAQILAKQEAARVLGWAEQNRYSSTPMGTGSLALGRAYARQLQSERAREYERQRSKGLDLTSRGGQVGGGAGGFDTEYTMLKYDTSYMEPQEDWTEEELHTYWGLLAMHGGDSAAADEYAISTNNRHQREINQAKALEVGEKATSSFVSGAVRTAGAVGAGLFSGLEYLGDLRERSVRGVITEKEFGLSDYSNAVTGSIGSFLNWEYGTVQSGLFKGKGLGDLYQVGVSIGQSWGAMALTGGNGALVSAMFFGQAAKSSLDENLAAGMDTDRAVTLAALNGWAEVLGEALPLDNIKTLMKGGRGALWKDLLLSAGIEGAGEAATTLLNEFGDFIVNGDERAYQIAIEQYVSQGMSLEDAERQATKDFLRGLANDFIAGAVSGGVGGGAIAPAINTVQKAAAPFKGDSASLLAAAQKMTGTDAAKLAEKYIREINEQNAREQRQLEKAQKQKESGTVNDQKQAQKTIDRLSSREERGLSVAQAEKLEKAMERAVRNENITNLNVSLRTELESRGVENAEELARIIYKSVKGEMLKKQEMEAFRAEPKAKALWSEMKRIFPKGRFDAGRITENSPEWIRNAQTVDSSRLFFNASYSKPILDTMLKQEDESGERENVGIYAVSPELREQMTQLYDPAQGMDAKEFATAIDEAISIAADVSRREAFERAEYVQKLNEEQREFAWAEGQRQREAGIEAEQTATGKAETAGKKTKGKGKREAPGRERLHYPKSVKEGGQTYKGVSENRIDRRTRDVISVFAETAKVDVVFYESDTDSKGNYVGANGFYRDGTVYLDIHAAAKNQLEKDAMLLTMAHELVHHIRENAPKEYRALKEFVVEHLLEKGFDFEKQVAGKLAQRDVRKREDAVEEVVADACEMVLRDSRAVQRMAEKDANLVRRINNWLHDWVNKIKEAFAGIEARSPEARALTEDMEGLVEAFDRALEAAAKKAGDSGYKEGKSASRQSEAEGNGKTHYSFKGSTSGMANDKLSSYDEEMTRLILSKGDYVIDSYAALESAVELAFSEPNAKATLYFGNLSAEELAQIEKAVPNLPKEIDQPLFKPGKMYSVVATLDSIRHLPNEKHMTKADVLNYMDRYADTIAEYDDVYFDYYYDSYNNRLNGLRFRKQFDDGYQVSFDIVSNKKRSLALITEFTGGKTIKKKPAKTLLLNKSGAHTPEARAGQTSENSIHNKGENVNGKYSLRDSDGKELSKDQQEYFRDSKARDAGGRLLVMYRGGQGNFTVFDRRKSKGSNLYGRGFYFTSSKEHAEQYGKARAFYLDIKHPLGAGHEISREQLRKFLKAIENDGEDYDLYNYGEGATAESVLRQVWGEDRTDFQMLYDINMTAIGDMVAATELFNEVNGTDFDGFILNTETVTFRSEQAKLTDNLKPSSSLDIRYSQRDSTEGLTAEEAKALREAYTSLKAEAAHNKERWEYWKNQTRRSKVRNVKRQDVEKLGRDLLKFYGSEGDRGLVYDGLEYLGNYLVNSRGDELNYETMVEIARDIAVEIAENAVEYRDPRTAYGDYESIAEDIKGMKFYMSAADIRSLPEGFRQQYRGKIHISTDKQAQGVDTAYMELQTMHGEGLFPAGVDNTGDQIILIAEAYDAVTAQPVKYNPFENHMNEAVISITNDIVDKMLGEEVQQTPPTFADKEEARVQKAKAEGRQALEKLRADKNARIEQIKREEVLKRQEMRAKEKAAKWEKAETVKEYYQNQIQQANERRKENASARKYRDRVYEKVETLQSWLINNTDKEHVPEALKAPLTEFLNSLDLSSKQQLRGKGRTKRDLKYTEALEKLRKLLEKQNRYMQEGGESQGIDVFIDVPPELSERIEEHIETVKSALNNDLDFSSPVALMDSDQLRDLDFILKTLTHAIRRLNHYATESHFAGVIESARDTMNFVDGLGEHKGKGVFGEGAEKFFAWTNAEPYYVFKRFGVAGMERFMAIMEGWGKMAANVERAIKYAESTYTEQEAREWESETHEIELSNGRRVTMSTAQIMGLWCLAKREQGLKHLYVGGMRIADIEPGKGKKRIAQTKAAALTAEDILKTGELLSARQKDVAQTLQRFMNTVCSDWGNEVSMIRYGYRAFMEENYYPILTDDNNHPAVDPKARETDLFRLINMSSTKPLDPRANNSVVIDSIFNVFANHAADMAKYNALALPILDALKWYNHKDKIFSDVESVDGVYRQMEAKSVQQSVEAAYGKQAKQYIINFLKDLNGVREGGRNEDVLKGVLGKYKAAAVGANLRVAIQQGTSIIRAAYMISGKYLARGAAMSGGAKEALQHSGIAKWKAMGFFDTNIARGMREQIKHTESVFDKARDKSMVLAQKGDEAVFGAIWNAAKLETQEKTRLSGEELMKATAKRFDEIIIATQVVDSTISRSDIMRSNSLAVSEVTSFMSEGSKSYNMLMDSLFELSMLSRQGSAQEARKKVWGKMGKAIAVWTTSQIAVAAAAAIVDAMRDDDEYETYAEKWAEHFWQNVGQNINPLNMLPLLGDLINTVLGKESPESMIYAPLTQINKAISASRDMVALMFDPAAKVSDERRTNWGRLYYIAQALSSVSGLPASGAMRDLKAVWNVSGALITGKKIKFYDGGVKNQVKYAVVDGYLTEEEAITYLLEAGEYEDADDAYWAIQDWLHSDDEDWSKYEGIHSAILADDSEAFKSAADALEDHGVSGGSVRSEAKSEIKRMYQGADGSAAQLDYKAAVKALQKFAGMGEAEATFTVDKWKMLVDTGIAYEDMQEEYAQGRLEDKQVREYLVRYGHEYPRDAAEKQRQWQMEKDTGIRYSYLSEAYIYGEISREEAIKYQMKYGGLTRDEADSKTVQWDAAREYGVSLGSSTLGIKKQLIEGFMSEETAKTIMMIYDGKTEEEAEDYVNQYIFTAETGYSFGEIGLAYAEGAISYDEMVDWYQRASIYTHGSRETAEEYAQVEVWKATVRGAESMNRTGLEKWTKNGHHTTNAGLDKEDFALAWEIYSQAEAKYSAEGEKTAEKAEAFFESLYDLYLSGVYSLAEIEGLGRTIYSDNYFRRYKVW